MGSEYSKLSFAVGREAKEVVFSIFVNRLIVTSSLLMNRGILEMMLNSKQLRSRSYPGIFGVKP